LGGLKQLFSVFSAVPRRARPILLGEEQAANDGSGVKYSMNPYWAKFYQPGRDVSSWMSNRVHAKVVKKEEPQVG